MGEGRVGGGVEVQCNSTKSGSRRDYLVKCSVHKSTLQKLFDYILVRKNVEEILFENPFQPGASLMYRVFI